MRARLTITASSLALLATACGSTPPAKHTATPLAASHSSAAAIPTAAPGSVVGTMDGGRAVGFFDGRIVETGGGRGPFTLLNGSTLAPLGDLTALTGLQAVEKADVAYDSSGAYVVGTRKGSGLTPNAEVLGRIGADGKFLWTVDASVIDLRFENKVVVLTDEGPRDESATNLVARDASTGRALYRISYDAVGRDVGDNDVNFANVSSDQRSLYLAYQKHDQWTPTFQGFDLASGRMQGAPVSETGDEYTFANGDVVSSANSSSVSRRGQVTWTVDAPGASIVAFNEHKVIMFGSSRDIVVLDAMTGAPIGSPIAETGQPYEGCPSNAFDLLTDHLLMYCNGGGGRAYAVAIP